MMQKAIRLVQKDASIWASLSLLCLFAIGTKTGISLDLLLVALSGFYLCASYQIRGCAYAIALLIVDAFARHTFLVTDHFFQLGLECSVGCAFFITALAFEQGSGLIDSLSSQLKTREMALGNLEEDLAKIQQDALNQKVDFQSRIAHLQKELEELQSEHSTILILNEVLRKTTAKHGREAETLSVRLQDAERYAKQVKAEFAACQKELERLKDSGELALANKELMEELNQARTDKAQTHLINETLARLYLKENLKAKDAEKEAEELSQELYAARKLAFREEAQREEIANLNRQIESQKETLASLSDQLKIAKEETMQAAGLRQQIDALQVELTKAQEEQRSVKVFETDPALIEQLDIAHAQINKLSRLEPQMRQLRSQFEEKSQILHEARSELFKSDTELQRLRMEMAAIELEGPTDAMEKVLYELSSELSALEEENKELQELVKTLSQPLEAAAKRKKKVKILPPEKEGSQALLF